MPLSTTHNRSLPWFREAGAHANDQQCTFETPLTGAAFARSQASHFYQGKHCTPANEAYIIRLMAMAPRGWDAGKAVPYDLSPLIGGRPSWALQCRAMSKLMHSEIQDKHNIKKLIQEWEPGLKFPKDLGTFRSADGITEEFVRSLPERAIFKATHTSGGVIMVDFGTATFKCLKMPCTLKCLIRPCTLAISPTISPTASPTVSPTLSPTVGPTIRLGLRRPATTANNAKKIARFLRENCAAWLKYNYEDVYGEMSYKHIPRGCMLEEIMYRTDVPTPSGTDFPSPTHDPHQLTIFVVHGRIMIINIASYDKNLKRQHSRYTADLKLLPGGLCPSGADTLWINKGVCSGRHEGCSIDSQIDPDFRRQVFAQAIRLAARSGAPEVRVDFMLQSRREVTFSELTFTSAACYTWFTPRVLDMVLGAISVNSSTAISSECFGEIADAVSCSPDSPYRGIESCDWSFSQHCKADHSIAAEDKRCTTAKARTQNPWACESESAAAVSSPSAQQLAKINGSLRERDCELVELELLFQHERRLLLRAFAARRNVV